MKKVAHVLISAGLLLILMAVLNTSNADARGGHYRPRTGINVWLGLGWWPMYYPFYYPYYRPYYYPQPPEEPEVFEIPTSQEEQQIYWYYCKDPQGYYPYVKKCPSGWLKVVPPSPGQDDIQPESRDEGHETNE